MSHRLRVLLGHNFYRFGGGEDVVFATESKLLESRGHDIAHYTVRNTDLRKSGLPRAAFETIWSARSYRRLQSLMRSFEPDIVHFHNTFPQLSPSVYYACQDLGVPVVQTLHNYRLICPQGGLLRDGQGCKLCLDSLGHSIRFSCYRGSRAATSVLAGMLTAHRAKGTWYRAIDRYVVLTSTMKALLTERNHLPADRITVRPNCLFPDPKVGEHRESFALFVGQLSEPKGIPLLLRAWEAARLPIGLKIVGDGPLHDDVEDFAGMRPELGIDVAGRLGNAEVLGLMQDASFLVFPSRWYECMPVVLIEAFACGLPVIAGNIGAMREMITDGYNGIHFRSGDPEDLAAKISSLASSPDRRRQIERAARQTYEQHYSSERGYESLMSVYESLLSDRNDGP